MSKSDENQVGINLVQSLREYLMAYGGMNFQTAQQIAEGFDRHINWVDWIEVNNGTKVYSQSWVLNK